MKQRKASKLEKAPESPSHSQIHSIKKELIRIINIPLKERTGENFDKMIREMEDFSFFRNFMLKRNNQSSRSLQMFFKHLTYKFYLRETIVCKPEEEKDQDLYFVLGGKLRSEVQVTYINGVRKQKTIQLQTPQQLEQQQEQGQDQASDQSEETKTEQESSIAWKTIEERVLEPGQTFGEIAFLTQNKNQENVVALEDCHIAVLNKRIYMEVIKLSKRINFFDRAFGVKLNWHEAKPLIFGLFTRQKLLRGNKVFRKGDKPDGFCIVKSGEIAIYQEIKYTLDGGDKSRPSLQENLERLIRAQTPLKKGSNTKRAKYIVQILSGGKLLGEEVLLNNNYTVREFDAECKSESAILYHIPQQVMLLGIFLHYLKDHRESILQKVLQDIEARNQKLYESDDYINKVLKPSRSLKGHAEENPFLRRTFSKDIPNTHAIINNNSRSSGNSLLNRTSVNRPYKALRASCKELVNQSNSGNETGALKKIKHLGDSFTLLQYMNKTNMQMLSQYQSEDPESMKNPFDIEKGLRFDTEKEQAMSEKIKVMVKARFEQKSPSKIEEQLRIFKGDTTIRRFAPKIKKIASNVKTIVKSSKDHEQLRQKIVRSASCEKVKVLDPHFDLELIRVDGLEASAEKNSFRKSIESFVGSDNSRNFKKIGGDIGEKELLGLLKVGDILKKKNSISTIHPLNLTSRASLGCSTNRETFGYCSEIGTERRSMEQDKRQSIIFNLTRCRQDEVNLNFFRAKDMIPTGEALGKEERGYKEKNKGGTQILERASKSDKGFKRLERNESRGSSSGFETKRWGEKGMRSFGGPMEFVKAIIEDTIEDFKERRLESSETTGNRGKQTDEKERLTEKEERFTGKVKVYKEVKMKRMWVKKEIVGGLSPHNVVKRTKHNLFRFRTRSCWQPAVMKKGHFKRKNSL